MNLVDALLARNTWGDPVDEIYANTRVMDATRYYTDDALQLVEIYPLRDDMDSIGAIELWHIMKALQTSERFEGSICERLVEDHSLTMKGELMFVVSRFPNALLAPVNDNVRKFSYSMAEGRRYVDNSDLAFSILRYQNDRASKDASGHAEKMRDRGLSFDYILKQSITRMELMEKHSPNIDNDLLLSVFEGYETY